MLEGTSGTLPRQTDDIGRSRVICNNGNFYTETDQKYVKDVSTYRLGISLPVKRDEYYRNICDGAYKLDYNQNYIEGKGRSWFETIVLLIVIVVFFEIVRRAYGYIVYDKNIWSLLK